MTHPPSHEPEKPDDTGLKARIDRIEDQRAVIVTADNQTLLVPKEHLPKDAKAGDDVWVTVQTHAMRDEHQKKMAKALLHEILNPEP